LLAQTRSLVNHWIIKFDPMDQNTTSKEEGLEYLSHTEGMNLLDYTQSIIKELGDPIMSPRVSTIFNYGSAKRRTFNTSINMSADN